ncbi:MAG: hypothetical protein WA705_10125 [Candidatus Ozemobacteraceae bacterium]
MKYSLLRSSASLFLALGLITFSSVMFAAEPAPGIATSETTVTAITSATPAVSPVSATNSTASMPQTLAKAAFKAEGGLDIVKTMRDDGIYLEAHNKAGKKIWESANLGTEDKNFLIGGASNTLAVVDFDKDGKEEVLTAAFYGPDASGLYIYRFVDAKTGFVPIPNSAGTEESKRDFFVSDVRQESGEDMVINPDGTVRVMGKIYSEKGENPPESGFYYFELKGNTFELKKTEKVKGQ